MIHRVFLEQELAEGLQGGGHQETQDGLTWSGLVPGNVFTARFCPTWASPPPAPIAHGLPCVSRASPGVPWGPAVPAHAGGRAAGLREKCVDSLVFETLVPKPMMQHYISLLLKHRRLVLSGPSGTGKTYLTNRLAEYLVERSGREVTEGIVSTFNMHQQSCKVALLAPPTPVGLPAPRCSPPPAAALLQAPPSPGTSAPAVATGHSLSLSRPTGPLPAVSVSPSPSLPPLSLSF